MNSIQFTPVTFGTAVIQITRHADRCWVSVDSLCEALSLQAAPQLRRLRRHEEKAGLQLHVHKFRGTVTVFMPLEEVQWFLRSVRPSTEDGRRLATAFRAGLFWYLVKSWVQINGGSYGSQREARSLMRKTLANTGAPLPPPAPLSRFRPGDTKRILDYRAQGLTYREIGDLMNCSPATVCLIAKGRYPVNFEALDAPAPSGVDSDAQEGQCKRH